MNNSGRQLIKGAICLYLINFDPHRIHIYNIVISPLVMSANVYLQNYLTHTSYTLVYVVVIAFDVLADVINIVNYTLIKCTIPKRLSSFEWFFFGGGGGGGYDNKNTSLLLLSLSLSLLDLIQHVYRCILELELPDLYILVTQLCTVRALMTLCRALRYLVTVAAISDLYMFVVHTYINYNILPFLAVNG